MPNRLAAEVSPYLLQHKDNPVAWWPWGPEALAEAHRTNRPILLSVGYAACHWCHVMAHESFENAETAAVMNDLFVNIKVDREERPDIDQIYMSALHALGEQGGWPLTMFLTPDAAPIWGGTYFPPSGRFGRPGFADVLREVSRVYRDEPDKVASNRQAILSRLSRAPEEQATVPVDRTLLDAASTRLLSLMDTDRGGTSGAPKFPQTSLFECLWRAGLRTGEAAYPDVVNTTLTAICQGGIYDHVGGGFARYSVDSHWLVPHFEKMLYDNAQLIELLTVAFAKTGNPLFAARVGETIDWLCTDMQDPEGGFAASRDADSDGGEGNFYVWQPAEIDALLSPGEAKLFAEVYDITQAGNWEGKSIPNRLDHLAMLSDQDEARLAEARILLRAHRQGRVAPGKDDKILADWNGLAIAAIALAGFVFDRADWIDSATGAYRFVATALIRDGRFGHAFRDGKTVFPGLATDYAFMIKAALALHGATRDQGYLTDAVAWSETFRRHHRDHQAHGYFLSADDAEALIVRPRADSDEAIPAATSIMTANLIRLWHLTGADTYRDQADAILTAGGTAISSNLYTATSLLNALDLRLHAVEIVVLLPPDGDPAAMIPAARSAWTPNTILSVVGDSDAVPEGHPAHGKTAVSERPTVYVCREGACSLPSTDPGALGDLLGGARVSGPGRKSQVFI